MQADIKWLRALRKLRGAHSEFCPTQDDRVTVTTNVGNDEPGRMDLLDRATHRLKYVPGKLCCWWVACYSHAGGLATFAKQNLMTSRTRSS